MPAAIEKSKKENGHGGINTFLEKEVVFFDLPLKFASRILILISILSLLPAFFLPLWNMTFVSNQYLDGLQLHIYAQQLEGGKTPDRDDLREINSLNHYIGMRPLLESDFSEFTWIPFVLGGLILLSLRAMVIGKMSGVVDVCVLFVYFGLFSLWSFYHRLYLYGHNLDPTAAIKVPPFTPPLFGTKVIANFTVHSYPDFGSAAMIAFGIFLLAAIVITAKQSKKK
jgi:copper chaperone NosL